VRPSKALEHRQLEVIDLLDRRGITDPQLIGPVARREDSEGDPIEILARLPDGLTARRWTATVGILKHGLQDLRDAPQSIDRDRGAIR
jgi:hypothetical protein